MVAVAVSTVKSSYVSEYSKRPSATNVAPMLTLEKLQNRFFYDFKALLLARHNPNSKVEHQLFAKLNNAVAYSLAWYGAETAGQLWAYATKANATEIHFNDLRAEYLPKARSERIYRDRNGEVIEFIWDVSDADRMNWEAPLYQPRQEDEGYDGFDSLAEFEIWDDQDTEGRKLQAERDDWQYTDRDSVRWPWLGASGDFPSSPPSSTMRSIATRTTHEPTTGAPSR